MPCLTDIEFLEDQKPSLKRELLKNLFESMPVSVIAIIINAVILSAVLWPVVPGITIFTWFTFLLLITMWRLQLSRSFLHDDTLLKPVQWQARFRMGVFASAMVWSSTTLLMFPEGNDLLIVFLAFVLGGISIGSISSLSADVRASSAFVAIILLPLIIRLGLIGETVHLSIAGMLMLFLIMLILMSLRTYRNLVSTYMIGLRYNESRHKLQESENRFRLIFQQVPVGIFYYNQNGILRIVDCNDELLDILRVEREQLFALDLNRMSNSGVLHALQSVFDDRHGFYNGEYTTMVAQISIWIELRCTPLHDNENNIIGGIGMVRDLTREHEFQERMKHMAYHDMLTKLPNRVLLEDRLHQALLTSQEHHHIGALLFMDLDNFKQINDSLGHTYGDMILIETAKRLQRALRAEDTISRIGGDEFIILLPELANTTYEARVTAQKVADTLQYEISDAYQVEHYSLLVTASIGVTLFGEKPCSSDDLLKQADAAMFEAKKRGKNKTFFYEASMDAMLNKRLELENELRFALSRNELEVYLQPINRLDDDTIIAAEAMVRWNHPIKGLVSPTEFIPMAEESGLIVTLGDWMIDNTLQILSNTNYEAISQLQYISINLSARQIQEEGFVSYLLEMSEKHNVSLDKLQFEMTETILIDNFNQAMQIIERLKEEKIRFAIDDFGTGYSSLSYLKYLKVNAIKIDREFIRDLLIDEDDAKLVSVILDLSHYFDLQIIAEGVETTEQKEYLYTLSKEGYYQGYVCSKPLPAEGFEALAAQKQLSTSGNAQ